MVTSQGKRWANLYPFIILGIGAIIGEISGFIAGIIIQDGSFYIAGFIYGIILFPIFVGLSNFLLQKSGKIKDSHNKYPFRTKLLIGSVIVISGILIGVILMFLLHFMITVSDGPLIG